MSFNTNLFHQIKVKGRSTDALFTVPKQYINLSYLSTGAQGIVVKAYDTVAQEQVAIKKIIHPFLTTMTARRTYREFVLLMTMKHPNIILLKNAFTPHQSLDDFDDIYVVMELMNYNLSQVIKQLKLDNKNLSYFTYQMIVAIKYMHRSGIIHRDLKPSNIVVNDKCILKILDFGLARKIETGERMTVYVVTRYYRAPEVILGLPYDEKVDVWAIGCILAEMINRKTLFPGTDRLDQWNKIIEILGTPSQEFINKLEHHTKNYVRSKGHNDPLPFEKIFPDECFIGSYSKAPQLCASVARDLLFKMLQIDPEKRISVDEAVRHPYVNLWFRDEEWNVSLPENRYDANYDLTELPINSWKELLFKEVKRCEKEHSLENTNSNITYPTDNFK
ncbi:CMGC/MAPK/JNK protein kinase [Loa loa]|uniref:Stress-activated protein kinase JNK n=1 Tax=Loa loa TaxID=7209 RepID=A0A1I7VFW8_LOALO|nr:CMGC/MAPK/JNK protein kinase [Loa loa]EFO16810.2 CMGC/MAPK/JNK protein kinase [Loa loa]